MIQYYLDLKDSIHNLSEYIQSQGQIQKIYSTAYYICFSIRRRGETFCLYFGRGGGHEGIWFGENPPVSEIRQKDTFLEYFRRYLSSCTMLDLRLDKADRIACLEYQKYGQKNSFLWFWKGRKLYFVHHYKETPESPMKLLLSWHGKAIIPTEDTPDLFALFDEIGRMQDSEQVLRSTKTGTITDLLEAELNEVRHQDEGPKKRNFLQRKKENIEADLEKAKQWEKLHDLLEQRSDLDSHHELNIADQKIKFTSGLNSYERRNLVFEKIKKLKKGERILGERLKKVEEDLVSNPVVDKLESKLPMVKPVWGITKEASLSKPRTQKKDYRLFKEEEVQFGVGLSSQGNDALRSEWGNKEDYWVHLDGRKSAHVIIKLLNNQPIQSSILERAASIVAEFSDYKDQWIPVIYTQVKNLKGVTGAAGMVIYKKEKHINCLKQDLSDLIKEEDV
jgi:predicted ribosome quality control (RQC) complex YloA/Tae2 family protein